MDIFVIKYIDKEVVDLKIKNFHIQIVPTECEIKDFTYKVCRLGRKV